MKKLLLLLLSALLLAGIALAEEGILNSGYFQYRLLEDGTVEIVGYTGSEMRIVVPGTLDGCQVTEIGNDSFAREWSVTSITLPEGIRRIGDSAFYNCQFSEFTIPDGVTEIGTSAFNSCYSLEYLVVPDSVTTIGRYAFSGCGEVIIPDSITSIDEGTFSECKFAEITLPSKLTYLGESAFSSNAYLKRIAIPAGVTAILDDTFYKCTSLETVVIPKTVLGIGDDAFYGCINLKMVYIPRSVGVINLYAFRDANPSLTIICEPGSAAETFAKKRGFAYEYATTEAQEMMNYAYLVNPDDTLTVTGYNGRNTELAIPATIGGQTVTAIGPAAFVGAPELRIVTLPDTVTTIGEYAFLGCKSLETVRIPAGVSEMGDAIAAYCPVLTLQVVENSAAHQYALANAMQYEVCLPPEPDYSDFVTQANDDGSLTITDYTGKETAIVVPAVISGQPVTAISAMAFTSAPELVSVILPDGLVTIGDFCFLGSRTLETLVIPASVQQIGSGVGMYCPLLTCVVAEGSAAHEYAESNGIPFEVLGK